MATFSPVGMWTADFTFPKVPLPRVLPGWGGRYLSHSCRWFLSGWGLVLVLWLRYFRSLSDNLLIILK